MSSRAYWRNSICMQSRFTLTRGVCRLWTASLSSGPFLPCSPKHRSPKPLLDLDGWHVIQRRMIARLAHLIATQRKVNQVSIAKQHDNEAGLITELVGKPTLHDRNDGASDNH